MLSFRERNWRLKSTPKAAEVSTPKPSLPSRPRFGIRNLLKSTPNTVPPTPNPQVSVAAKDYTSETISQSPKGSLLLFYILLLWISSFNYTTYELLRH